MSARRPPRGRLYEALDGFAVRAPMLPVTHDEATATAPAVPGALTPADPRVHLAIALAAPDLAASLAGTTPDSSRAPRLRRALLRYRIRMATRPTPFGLFAGLGLGFWGPQTTLALADGPRPVAARPDMGWLVGFVQELQERPDVRRALRLVANSCVLVRDGRAYLTEPATAGRPTGADVSVRATPAVRAALALARTPIGYTDLAAALLGRPGASEERVHALLDELWERGLLLTDLMPPLTADPVAHVVHRLEATGLDDERAALADVSAAAAELTSVAAAATAPDGAAAAATALAVLDATRTRARAVRDPGDAEVVQVDSGLALRGSELSSRVASEAIRAVELLLRLHPAPAGPPYLAAYRSAFVARYGHHRLVGVAELLDPRFGLGPPSGHVHGGQPHGHPDGGADRDDALRDLAHTALRDGVREVELDEELLERLSTWRPSAESVPASLELSAFVIAASAAAVDRGDFRLVVGPNLGAQAAGRGLGRFVPLLGDDGRALLAAVARREEEANTDAVFAELVYLPANARSANVTVRSAVRGHEVAIGVSPGVGEAVVPVDELAVTVSGDRFRLWWPARGREVVVCSGHMLNSRAAPAICRLLADLSLDGIATLSDFDWGPAATLPSLPRVRSGRVVLRAAEWRQRRETAARDLRVDDAACFPDALRRWRDRTGVPRHVYVAAGDNRLLLDLDDPDHADVLRGEVQRDRAWHLVVEEALPGPDDMWLEGPGGRYASEIVVPLVRVAVPSPAQAPPPRPSALVLHPEQRRRRPPGSDWLFLTLHGPRDSEDEIITGPLRAFAEGLVTAGSADSWWFLRYADPQPHVRLRLHGAPDALLAEALPAAARWAADLVARGLRTRFAVEVYEREIERYGGEEGMALAEALFAADSVAVAALLAACTDAEAPVDRLSIAAASIDDLLATLGFGLPGRRAWYGEQAGPPKESADAYRERSARLRAVLAGDIGALGDCGAAVSAALARRREALTPLSERLDELDRERVLSVPLAEVARSYVHLHANRLLGVDGTREGLVLGLLRRTLTSLLAAPLEPAGTGGRAGSR